ncbi:MAG TPA: uroporphyrinogen decarboxylase family protein [Candidatus Limnocylindrales bacterium]|nr:uroporphyrinogen decarboxylase family protein [Candidatus Limnocylindrales bacterium]
MTSRERILAAVNHLPVDRVPIDFGGTRQSGISAWAYIRLRERLGLALRRPARIFDTYQMLAEIEQDVADRFGADCVALNRPAIAFGIRNENWKIFEFEGLRAEVPGGFNPEPDGEGGWVLRRDGQAIAAMPAGGFYFDRLEKYPGATHPDLATWRVPRLDELTLEHFHVQAELLFTGTDKAVIAALGPPYELFNGIGQGGFEQWMLTFASEPEYVNELYAELVEAWLQNLVAFHAAVGDRVQIIQICDDFGTQHAPFLSAKMFRERLLPAYKRALDWIHGHTPWKVLLHSDGALVPLLPSIIEMGVDILNPVQTSAAGMNPEHLKREFGSRLVFWGGSCDPQSTFVYGTPREVAAETEKNLAVFTQGSGYVCAPIHNIQTNVPPDNVIALFDTALNFHERPISSSQLPAAFTRPG